MTSEEKKKKERAKRKRGRRVEGGARSKDQGGNSSWKTPRNRSVKNLGVTKHERGGGVRGWGR